MGFGRFFIPAHHLSETHFCPITKIWSALHQNFGKKCLKTSWIIKSTFLGSPRAIFEACWSISIDSTSLFSWKTHIFDKIINWHVIIALHVDCTVNFYNDSTPLKIKIIYVTRFTMRFYIFCRGELLASFLWFKYKKAKILTHWGI